MSKAKEKAPGRRGKRAGRGPAATAPSKRRRMKQANLPNVLTGPEVQKLLGGVSHVTVHKLWLAGKLKRVGPAKQQGGGFLYDAVEARKFAKTYKPQRNAPAKKKSKRARAKGVTVARLSSGPRGIIKARRA